MYIRSFFLKKFPTFIHIPKHFFSKEGISNSSKTPLYDTYRQFHNVALEKLSIPGVTIVKDPADAIKVANILKGLADRFYL